LYYGFSQYAVHPRNNDDIIGLSVELEAAKYAADTATNTVQELSNLGVSFYPNPTNNVLTVSLETEKMGNISIKGLDGRELLSEEIFGRKSIDVSSLSSGVYFIQFTNQSGVKASAKFIKL
jgi:hypothetical protein